MPISKLTVFQKANFGLWIIAAVDGAALVFGYGIRRAWLPVDPRVQQFLYKWRKPLQVNALTA
jgi:hypothetical protein